MMEAIQAQRGNPELEVKARRHDHHVYEIRLANDAARGAVALWSIERGEERGDAVVMALANALALAFAASEGRAIDTGLRPVVDGIRSREVARDAWRIPVPNSDAQRMLESMREGGGWRPEESIEILTRAGLAMQAEQERLRSHRGRTVH